MVVVLFPAAFWVAELVVIEGRGAAGGGSLLLLNVKTPLHLLVLLILHVLVVQHVVVQAQFDLLVEQIQSLTQQLVLRLVAVQRHQPTIVETCTQLHFQ